MHKFASFNHEIFPANDIKINAISSAGLYGKGIFTTIVIKNSTPFLWEKHWRRLHNNAKKIGVDLSEFTEQKIYELIKELINKNKALNARCRLTFFDESQSKIWQNSVENKTSILIQTAEFRESKEHLNLTVSPFPINSNSPIAGVKSCNYLENILAIEDAKTKGFDEAIRVNEKSEITSACMANIFWIKDDKIFTPDLKTGCLAGTTREFIMENHKVFEVKESIESVKNADRIFLTSSGIGLCAASINNKSNGNNSVFTVLKKQLENQK